MKNIADIALCMLVSIEFENTILDLSIPFNCESTESMALAVLKLPLIRIAINTGALSVAMHLTKHPVTAVAFTASLCQRSFSVKLAPEILTNVHHVAERGVVLEHADAGGRSNTTIILHPSR